MKLREMEIWQERGCIECTSRENVKELVVGNETSSTVMDLCERCRKELYDTLFQEIWS